MLIFVGQRPSFSPSFFASSLSTFVSIFLINSPSSFCSIDNRRVIGMGKNKVYCTNVNGGRVFPECSSIYTPISSPSCGTSYLRARSRNRFQTGGIPPPPSGYRAGRGPPPSSLSPTPPPSNPFTPLFFPTPDQFLETSRRRQTPTPHSRTRVAPPTPSDRDPIRDRVRGREYPHPLPPLRAHEGVPPLCCVFRSPTKTPGSAASASCANRGTPPPHMP